MMDFLGGSNGLLFLVRPGAWMHPTPAECRSIAALNTRVLQAKDVIKALVKQVGREEGLLIQVHGRRVTNT